MILSASQVEAAYQLHVDLAAQAMATQAAYNEAVRRRDARIVELELQLAERDHEIARLEARVAVQQASKDQT